MDLIILLIIIWLVYKAIQKRKASKQIAEAAKRSACTNEIIRTLRILSGAKVDRVDCVLSLGKFTQHYDKRGKIDGATELVSLKIVFTSDELAQVLKTNQQSMSETLKEIDESERIGDHQEVLRLLGEVSSIRKNAAESFEMFFGVKPDHKLMAEFALNYEYSISGNQSTGDTGYFVDELGVAYSKYGALRSLYVLDAVEEQAQNIPNIHLDVDKTIPSETRINT